MHRENTAVRFPTRIRLRQQDEDKVCWETTVSHMSEHSVLFISAGGSAAAGVQEALRGSAPKLAVKRVDALFDGLHALQECAYDLVLADLSMPDGQGLITVSHLQQHAPRTPVIVLCHAADRDSAVQAVRKGAHDFYSYDDADTTALLRSIQKALNGAPPVEPKPSEAEKRASERRNHARFPCRLAITYQTLESPIRSGQGASETLNISSKGILFTSDERFETGQLVQVSLDWPARLENQVPLKLVAEGRVVRSAEGKTAMTIDKYEFRTRRAGPATPSAPLKRR